MPRHVLFTVPNWGHCRPELTLASRLIQLHPHLSFTLFLPTLLEQLSTDALGKCRLTDEQRTRLEVIHYPLAMETLQVDPFNPAADDGSLVVFCNWLAQAMIASYSKWLEVRLPVQARVNADDLDRRRAAECRLARSLGLPRAHRSAQALAPRTGGLGSQASVCGAILVPVPALVRTLFCFATREIGMLTAARAQAPSTETRARFPMPSWRTSKPSTWMARTKKRPSGR